MTISGLVQAGKVCQEKFDSFFASLENLEKKYSSKLKFCVVSGTSQQSALKRFDLLQTAFKRKKRADMFDGFAYEYGGRFIDKDRKFHEIGEDVSLSDGERGSVLQIAKKFKIQVDPCYELYMNFDGEENNSDLRAFTKECEKKLKGLDVVYFNDKDGVGCDIKKPALNKGLFLKWYLKDKAPELIVVGGDAAEDLDMLADLPQTEFYFVGFASSNLNQNKTSKFMSALDNIDGIVDGLTAITKYSMKHYTFDVYNIKTNASEMLRCYDFIVELLKKHKITSLGKPNIVPYYYGKVKEDDGISLFCFLEPIGHITMHNFERRGKAYIDIFTSADLDFGKLKKQLTKFLSAGAVDGKKLEFNMCDLVASKNAFGPHFILETCNDSELTLTDVFAFLDKLPQAIKMTPITLPHVYENDEAIWGIRLIAESHISLYYLKKFNYIFVDVFSCVMDSVDLIKAELNKMFPNAKMQLYIRGGKYEEK